MKARTLDQQHGPITGSGPGFADAMRKFKARQAQAKEVGTFRHAPCSWKQNRTGRTDCDYMILDNTRYTS